MKASPIGGWISPPPPSYLRITSNSVSQACSLLSRVIPTAWRTPAPAPTWTLGPQQACNRRVDITPMIQRWRPMGKHKDTTCICIDIYRANRRASAVIGASWTQFKVFSWPVEQKFRALLSLASFITTKVAATQSGRQVRPRRWGRPSLSCHSRDNRARTS